ncbi:hypothetical protein ABIA33_001030 [Streptacidiphilus sp. MAP12-16]
MNVSAGLQRRLPKALALALLVGGTSAFVSQQHQARLNADSLPQRVRLDADPASSAESHDAAPPAAPTALTPAPAHLHAGPPSRSATRARHALRYGTESRHTRSMPEPQREDSPATHHITGDLNWSALARCEAGGDPHAVDPSGRYGGLYQFDRSTWHRLGGAGRPQDAPAEEQTARARRLYQQRGASPWPSCGHRAGG